MKEMSGANIDWTGSTLPARKGVADSVFVKDSGKIGESGSHFGGETVRLGRTVLSDHWLTLRVIGLGGPGYSQLAKYANGRVVDAFLVDS
jgi:hypothetical protein